MRPKHVRIHGDIGSPALHGNMFNV